MALPVYREELNSDLKKTDACLGMPESSADFYSLKNQYQADSCLKYLTGSSVKKDSKKCALNDSI